MMESDVLDSFETIKACVAYKMDEEEIDYFPFDINETVEPVYVELPGWQTDMTKMQSSRKNSMHICHSWKNSLVCPSRLFLWDRTVSRPSNGIQRNNKTNR